VVQLGDAGLGAPPADHLADAVHGHGLPVLGPQPQRRFGGPLVPPPHPQVAIEGRGRLGTERHGPRTAALPHHGGQLVVEVDVSDRAVSELGQAQASVGEQPQDRLVAPVDEALAGAGGDQGPQPVGREHRHGPLGHHRRAHLLHRVGPRQLALLREPAEELLQRPEPHRRGRRRARLDPMRDEVGHVVAGDVVDVLVGLQVVVTVVTMGFEPTPPCMQTVQPAAMAVVDLRSRRHPVASVDPGRTAVVAPGVAHHR
jgi:hypothetical protein